MTRVREIRAAIAVLQKEEELLLAQEKEQYETIFGFTDSMFEVTGKWPDGTETGSLVHYKPILGYRNKKNSEFITKEDWDKRHL